MDIIIQCLGFPTSEALNAHIQEKVGHLKSDVIVRANVTLYFGSDANPNNQICEIRLEVPGNDLFVKKGSSHFEAAVTECVDILNQQIKKQRGRSVDRRHANEDQIQDELMAGEEEDDNTEPELEDVVK
jgi:ribosome-associated translation inhibitor RaiA